MSKLSDIIAIKALVAASLSLDSSRPLYMKNGNYSHLGRCKNGSYSDKLRNRITAKNLERIKK